MAFVISKPGFIQKLLVRNCRFTYACTADFKTPEVGVQIRAFLSDSSVAYISSLDAISANVYARPKTADVRAVELPYFRISSKTDKTRGNAASCRAN